MKLPPSNTGLGPEKTSFFQALSIATKISKGSIEMISEVHLIKFGEKVGASEAALLQMLKIFPFSYGLKIVQGTLSVTRVNLCMDMYFDLSTFFPTQCLKVAQCFLPVFWTSKKKTLSSSSWRYVKSLSCVFAGDERLDVTYTEHVMLITSITAFLLKHL